jgi:signal transduction histidine kinase
MLVEGLNRGAQRMHAIIEDMLDLSAIDTKQLLLVVEEVKLEKTIALVIAQLNRALAERQHNIQIINLDTLPAIQADSQRMHQIFRQIISNAIKYTPDGGQITISGQWDGVRPETLQITIQDTGVGIAPEDKEKIFEKFYRAGNSALHSSGQTKFMGAGPGLGLAIAKGLIEAHGGQIRADSPGFDMQNCPGASFTVILPLKAAPPPDIEIRQVGPNPVSEISK